MREAQFKELMQRSSEISMQQIRNITGLEDARLNDIYNMRLRGIVEYFRQMKAPQRMMGALKTDNFKGMVSELNYLEYDTFSESDAGKQAVKDGIIESSWIEYLLGAGGVKIYNTVAQACGLQELKTAKESFESLKRRFNNELKQLDDIAAVKNEIDAFLQGSFILKFDPVKDLAANFKLSRKARQQLVKEYLVKLANSKLLGNISNFTMDQTITAIQNRDAELQDQMQKLRNVCAKSGIDLRAPMQHQATHIEQIAAQSSNKTPERLR